MNKRLNERNVCSILSCIIHYLHESSHSFKIYINVHYFKIQIILIMYTKYLFHQLCIQIYHHLTFTYLIIIYSSIWIQHYFLQKPKQCWETFGGFINLSRSFWFSWNAFASFNIFRRNPSDAKGSSLLRMFVSEHFSSRQLSCF